MELKSRLVFVDTNIYEGKNFQFLTHSLGALKNLIDDGEVRLLVTEVTKREVISHIRKEVDASISELKSIKKKSSMILRNLPNIPAHGIFSDISASDVANQIIQNFETFLDSENVEIVSIDAVKPSYVFDRYFSLRAPFAAGEKEKEFADAFVLKAIEDLSTQRRNSVHIISNDKDMLRFADEHPGLVWSNSIDEFIDAVNKSVSIEPAAFAALALEYMKDFVMENVEDYLGGMHEEFDFGGWDSELDSVQISDIELVAANLIEVDNEGCTYDLEFTFVAETLEFEKDYSRSPFDHEDDNYPFVLENEVERTFDVEMSMQLKLSYEDKLIESVGMELEPPAKLKLSAPYNESVKYLDINGE